MTYEDWIPVKQELPPEYTRVLVCTKRGGFYIAEHRERGGWYRLNSPDHSVNPIAWAAIPDPYEEK